MIHPILYYMVIYFLLGGIGMYLASRKLDATTQNQRWLKYVVYILIISSVIGSILLEKFLFITVIITVMGGYELVNVLRSSGKHRWVIITTIAGYILLSTGLILFSLRFSQNLLLFINLQVFTFDGFSQIFGQLFGRHPLIPQISPGKTIEGLVGGSVVCLLSAMLARNWVSFPLLTACVVGLTTAVLAFSGDVLASYLKRYCSVKDYSTLLPGHGGFLDRFDSLIMTGMGYVCLLWTFK